MGLVRNGCNEKERSSRAIYSWKVFRFQLLKGRLLSMKDKVPAAKAPKPGRPKGPVRKNVWVDEKLLTDAINASGRPTASDAVAVALKELVHRHNATKLAKLLGSDPTIDPPGRRT